MAEFNKAIPPGGEGKIKLSVQTKGYSRTITKSARVYTNDPAKKIVRLTVKAFVKVPIYVSSPKLTLHVKEDQSIAKVVEVRAELDKPLELTPVQFSLADKLTYTIKEIERGRRFEICFTSMPGPPQSYRGFLKLKTNYPEKPDITLRIRGLIHKKNMSKGPSRSGTIPSPTHRR
ncbi:MAG: hypothetical protein SV775_06735 [Thermodesulfobacteriota bacterium]|nr:hypothetical protein [Thermodesulfobacteriota bacterium]